MIDIAPIADIIAEIQAGHMVILVDEEDRENEGDLLCAAEFITPEKIKALFSEYQPQRREAVFVPGNT